MKHRIQGLYAITDEQLIAPKKFTSKVRQALVGGAKVIQFRDKSQHHQRRFEQASAMVALCKEYGAVSIINDDIELAKTVQADGVHIGAEDDDIAFARQQLGEKAIIGVSCYADLDIAKKAIAESADYVAFGSVFASSTKPQAPVAGLAVLEQAAQELAVPVVAIGGIDLANLAKVLATGIDSVAIISGVFAQEDISAVAKQFSGAFNSL